MGCFTTVSSPARLAVHMFWSLLLLLLMLLGAVAFADAVVTCHNANVKMPLCFLENLPCQVLLITFIFFIGKE